jgi:hypothetical protein
MANPQYFNSTPILLDFIEAPIVSRGEAELRCFPFDAHLLEKKPTSIGLTQHM